MDDLMLATANLDIKRIEHRDAGAMHNKWMTDKELLKCCPWDVHKTKDVTHEFIKAEHEKIASGNYYAWGLFLDDYSSGKARQHICGYATLDIDADTKVAKVFIVVCRSEQNKGYAYEALCKITGFAFSKLGANCVTVAIPYFNAAGKKLLEKVGYTLEYQFTSSWRGVSNVPMLRYQYTREQYDQE